MSGDLLHTKLYLPRIRPFLVPRSRLIEKLNQGLQTGGQLTLISASAGFGKTTLLSAWITSCTKPVAWLSLDERDSDPRRFIAYLIAAIQKINSGIGEGLLAALQTPEPPQDESILTILLNEISSTPNQFLLILDDYHTIDSQQVDQSLTFLIEHQPPQMHLVIATREDPSLPLSRLRARGQLTELRTADLRFTPFEAAEFLNQVMGLTLSAEEIAALETRTEGWIAGLQLAALSIQGVEDTTAFIKSFTGSHRFVLDYLLEEVFQQQSEPVQTFLLCTSILDRLCGPLCDAVLGTLPASGQETLEYLEHANLFLVPLDNERRWYRYHHLFAELLRQRLGQRIAPEEIAELHTQASKWFENNSLMLEAFRHAVVANDLERAEWLMESKKMPLQLPGTAKTILNWLESLPKTLLDAKPALWWKQASLLLTIGQTTSVEERLQATEAALASAALSGAALDDATRDLIGKVASARATLATHQFDIETILFQARHALEYLAPNNLSDRATALLTLGQGCYLHEDHAAAGQAYTEALALAQADGDVANTILASLRLGQIQALRNQLHQAAETYQQVLELIQEYSPSNAAAAYIGLADINYEWNNLDKAEKYLAQSAQWAEQYDHVVDRLILSSLYLARLKLAQGDVVSAEQIASQAEKTVQQKNIRIRLQDLAYCQSQIRLRQGNLNAVFQLAQQHDLPLMQARALITLGNPSGALEVVEPLRQQAEAKGWSQRVLEVMTVQSTALYASGETAQALDLLGRVLALAEPGGYIRLFLNEGDLMAELLAATAVQGIRSDYVHKLLSAFEAEKKREHLTSSFPAPSSFVEPLSPRELEVLRLLAQGLTNQEIGQRLFLALDTVKGHNRRIFEKLQVQRRTEAIIQARELGLI